jgi:hypothetical protein
VLRVLSLTLWVVMVPIDRHGLDELVTAPSFISTRVLQSHHKGGVPAMKVSRQRRAPCAPMIVVLALHGSTTSRDVNLILSIHTAHRSSYHVAILHAMIVTGHTLNR